MLHCINLGALFIFFFIWPIFFAVVSWTFFLVNFISINCDYKVTCPFPSTAAPLATLLSNRFGHRPVVMMGGFLISLGTTTSAFTNSINDMYITIGIISGTYKKKRNRKWFNQCRTACTAVEMNWLVIAAPTIYPLNNHLQTLSYVDTLQFTSWAQSLCLELCWTLEPKKTQFPCQWLHQHAHGNITVNDLQ